MKKFLIGLITLIVITAVALGIFIATFDANRYRLQAAQGIETVLGSPASIGGISLGWRGGLALELKKLSIYRDRQTLDKPVIFLEQASVRVRLLPLLGKKLEIVSVKLVRPKLNVIREADGSIHINGIQPPASQSKPTTASIAASQTSPETPLAALFIGSVKIEGAEIGFIDRSPTAPFQVAIHQLDILVRNLSFSNPVDFQASMAIFSAAQNIKLEGRVRISSMTGPYVLENFKTSVDLSGLKLDELKDSVPSLKDMALREGLAGRLNGTIRRLKIEGKGISDLDAALDFTGGRIAMESLRSPLTNMNLETTATQDNLQLKNLSAGFANGKISASGVSKNYLTESSQTSLNLQINKISLTEVLPPANSYEPQLHGIFSSTFNGQVKGMSWPIISKTLTGSSEVSLTEGVVTNLNVLKFVFDKLSQIPGVATAVNQQLPPQYRQILSKRDTEIPPLKFPVQIVNGVLMIPNLEIIMEGFSLYTSGQVSLEGTVNCQATFVLDPQLTAIIAQNAPQIEYIVDQNKRLAIPVKIRGEARNLRIEPDMDYVLSRVMENKGKELIGNAIQKALAKSQPSAPASGSGEAPQETSYQKVLSKLLQ